jgi:hypothetical protein
VFVSFFYVHLQYKKNCLQKRLLCLEIEFLHLYTLKIVSPAFDGTQKFVHMFTKDQMIQIKDMVTVLHYLSNFVIENQISIAFALSKWVL